MKSRQSCNSAAPKVAPTDPIARSNCTEADFKEGAAKVEYDNLNHPMVRIEVVDDKIEACGSFHDSHRQAKKLAIFLDDDCFPIR